jgi:hypothetical protein
MLPDQASSIYNTIPCRQPAEQFKFPFSIIPDRFWWVLIFLFLSGMGENVAITICAGVWERDGKYGTRRFVFQRGCLP